MNMKVTVIWCVTPCGAIEKFLCFGTAFFCSADDGSRGFLRNDGVFVPDYTCYVPADSTARKVNSDSRVNVDSVDIATV
jgi:hypothetical protein